MIRRVTTVAGAAVGAAVASALCCTGPIIVAVLGVSGGALASAVEPLRPLFLGMTGLALGGGYLLVRREDRRACEPGTVCASPAARRRTRVMLGVATVLAAGLATYPIWTTFL